MKFHRNIIWLVPLFFVATFPLWSAPVSTFLTPRGGIDESIKKAPPKSHDFNMDMVRITQNQDGKRTAFIVADKANTGSDPDLLHMENVNADIFDDEGNVTKVSAKKGNYHTVKKLLTLIEDVVVNKTLDNQVLYTQLLHYNSVERTVACPGPTRMEGETFTVDGGSLDYDITTNTYLVGNRVYCVINSSVKP